MSEGNFQEISDLGLGETKLKHYNYSINYLAFISRLTKVLVKMEIFDLESKELAKNILSIYSTIPY